MRIYNSKGSEKTIGVIVAETFRFPSMKTGVIISMKQLGFAEPLVPLVLSGAKTITWRLFDDKNIQVGDELELASSRTRQPFARARVIKVVEKTFRDLDASDKDGHESFTSDEEMYQTYSDYYKTEVTPVTLLKIIHFEINK